MAHRSPDTGSCRPWPGGMGLLHLGAALIVFLLAGQPPKAAAAQVIGDSLACDACRIVMRVVARLGTVDAPGAIPGVPGGVVLDARGRFWLTFFRSPPMVFDSGGAFVSEVGRRGSGPGEYRYASLAVAAGDSVAVFDLGKVTVVGPDFQWVREVRLSNVGQVLDVRALAWPQAVVANGRGRRAREDLPLHSIDMSGAVAAETVSFVDARVPRNTPIYLTRRSLSASTSGRVWTLENHDYRIVRWDSTGQVRDRLVRSSSWGPAPDAPYSYGNTESPPSPYLAGIHEDADGRLWVIGRVASEDYSRVWAEAQSRVPALRSHGVGGISASLLPSERELYDTMIEVIDPIRQVVLTRHRFDGHALRFLRDDRLAVYRETEVGVPYIEIVELRIEAPGRQR